MKGRQAKLEQRLPAFSLVCGFWAGGVGLGRGLLCSMTPPWPGMEEMLIAFSADKKGTSHCHNNFPVPWFPAFSSFREVEQGTTGSMVLEEDAFPALKLYCV